MRRTQAICLVLLLMGMSGRATHAGLLELDEVFSTFSEADRYIQANFAGTFPGLDSGGLNTAGPHINTGDNEDAGVGFGGAVGLTKSYDSFRMRTEVEGMWRQNADYVTNSFPGPPGPITFFYQVQSTDNWSAMSNLWLDVPITDTLWLYGGGGIGAAGMSLSVNDTVVAGQKSKTNFAYQVGSGLILPIGDAIELDLGYRFLDAGRIDVALDGGASGNYVADLVSHQIMFCFRLNLR